MHTVLEVLARGTRGEPIADAVLSGTATAVRSHGGIVFFDLHDGTSSIQVVLKGSAIIAVHVGDRLAVVGRIDRTERGTLSLFASEPPRTVLPSGIRKSDRLARTFERIGASVVLARAQRIVHEALIARGFTEVVPRMISSSRWDAEGMTPLKVVYPGFGAPAFLAISPLPQLLQTVLQTGRSRVFASSRVFTLEHRGEGGNESAIVMSCALLEEIAQQQAVTSELLDSLVLGDLSTDPIRSAMAGGWNRFRFDSLGDARRTVSSPEIHGVSLASEGMSDEEQISSPPRLRAIERYVIPPSVVVAEDAVLQIGDITVGSACLYLDHYVASLGWEDVRRLGALDA